MWFFAFGVGFGEGRVLGYEVGLLSGEKAGICRFSAGSFLVEFSSGVPIKISTRSLVFWLDLCSWRQGLDIYGILVFVIIAIPPPGNGWFEGNRIHHWISCGWSDGGRRHDVTLWRQSIDVEGARNFYIFITRSQCS